MNLRARSPTRARRKPTLDWRSPLNDSDQDRRNCQNQKNVDEPAESVGRRHSQEPHHKQDYEDCPKHCLSPFVNSEDFCWNSMQSPSHSALPSKTDGFRETPGEGLLEMCGSETPVSGFTQQAEDCCLLLARGPTHRNAMR